MNTYLNHHLWKFLSLPLAVVILMSLSSCGDSNAESSELDDSHPALLYELSISDELDESDEY